MSKLKLYKYLCLGLLLLNIGLISFFLLTNGGKPPKHKIFKNEAVEILELDENQETEFANLAQEHGDKMRDLERQQADLLKPYFTNLINGNSEMEIPANALAIEKEKINITHQHFKDVKSLLKPEQKENFAAFMKGALRNIMSTGNNNKGDRPPRNNRDNPPPRQNGDNPPPRKH